MLFNSYTYPLYLGITLLLFWILPVKYRTWFLILTGLLFYVVSATWAIVVISLLGLFTYVFGQNMVRSGESIWKTLFVIAGVVMVFTYFKYTTLLLETWGTFTNVSVQIPNIIMPLGISFFVFEFIHYITDIHRGLIKKHSFKEFVSFVFFFPTMISGPIKRFEQFSESLSDHRWHAGMIYKGGLLIVLGYAQKYIFADPLIVFTQELSAPQLLQTSVAAAGGLVFYSLRIYFDFAGLSNIAIGSALLFGITVPKNFNNPYLRSNIQNFWNNWHMSLSSWVRDYIYISLGGSRKGAFITLINLLVAMLVVGIWHGASWNFAVWGLYHGIGLCIHRLWNKAGFSFGSSWIGYAFGTIVTFAFVTLGWAFFVTDSLSDSIIILQKLFQLP